MFSSNNPTKKSCHQTTLAYPASKRSEKNHELDEFLNPKGNFHDVNYLGYTMPGFFEKIHEWCGEWKTKGCLNVQKHKNKKAYIRRYQRSCYRADCRTCCKKWLARLANRSTSRIMIYESYNVNEKAKHVMVSPPSWISHKSLKLLRKEAYRMLKKVGCHGGTMIFHAYRSIVKDEQKYWYYSPHFHVVGYGWIVGADKTFQEHGWVIKNIGIRKSVFQTLFYQLSHCAIQKGKHCLTWFGDLSYHNSILKVEIEPILSLCPECHKELVELEFTGVGEPPPNEIFEGFVDAVSYFAPIIPYIRK